MTVAPLPVAPRPRPGEALSSWVRRIAACYGLEPHDLIRHILGHRAQMLGRVERLDNRADPELEHGLAEAASIDIARIQSQRIVSDDGAAWTWHRTRPAWCPQCVRDDLQGHDETYQRASWRLGCCVLCPAHGLILEDTCRRCLADAGCRFRGAEGRVKLECDRCANSPDKPLRHAGDGSADRQGAFGIRVTPELTVLQARLQADLQAALRGRSPHHKWWPVRTAAGLVAVVRDLTESLIWSTGTRVNVPIDWEPIAGEPSAMRLVHGPITPAVLRVYGARGALALIAAVLQAASSTRPPAEHRWRLNDVSRIVSLEMFVGCLPESDRRWLWRRAAHWEGGVRDRLETALAAGQTIA